MENCGSEATGSGRFNSRSMSFSSGASSGDTSETADPEPPARAVRPMR